MNLLKDYPFPEPVEGFVLVVLDYYDDGALHKAKLFEVHTTWDPKLVWMSYDRYTLIEEEEYYSESELVYWSLLNKNSNVTT